MAAPACVRAGLERLDDVTPPGSEPIGKPPGLGALAAGVASLEDDERGHLRTRLGGDARRNALALSCRACAVRRAMTRSRRRR